MSDTITEIVLIICGITFSYVLMKSIATNNIGRWVEVSSSRSSSSRLVKWV
nr:MAG TPA: hypothetical protein [Caudoviricetes sp.]